LPGQIRIQEEQSAQPSQTAVADIGQQCKFENDVKMYGTQTKHREIIKDSYTWNFKNVAYSA
ncbi:hypothetical protein, partial [[Ruminococcus] lactaris]